MRLTLNFCHLKICSQWDKFLYYNITQAVTSECNLTLPHFSCCTSLEPLEAAIKSDVFKMSTYTTCIFSVPVWKEHYIAVLFLSCPVLVVPRLVLMEQVCISVALYQLDISHRSSQKRVVSEQCGHFTVFNVTQWRNRVFLSIFRFWVCFFDTWIFTWNKLHI